MKRTNEVSYWYQWMRQLNVSGRGLEKATHSDAAIVYTSVLVYYCDQCLRILMLDTYNVQQINDVTESYG